MKHYSKIFAVLFAGAVVSAYAVDAEQVPTTQAPVVKQEATQPEVKKETPAPAAEQAPVEVNKEVTPAQQEAKAEQASAAVESKDQDSEKEAEEFRKFLAELEKEADKADKQEATDSVK